MGAKEICLTVTHEGGFALWPSNFTNYSVAHSHWRSGGGDVVADFVASCRRHDILPCFYMAPPHMGNLMLEGLSPDDYMGRVNGMLTELLTNYGTIHVRPQPSLTPDRLLHPLAHDQQPDDDHAAARDEQAPPHSVQQHATLT